MLHFFAINKFLNVHLKHENHLVVKYINTFLK